MELHKFVVLIVVLMMLLGLTAYIALDSDIFVHENDVVTVDPTSNTVNN